MILQAKTRLLASTSKYVDHKVAAYLTKNGFNSDLVRKLVRDSRFTESKAESMAQWSGSCDMSEEDVRQLVSKLSARLGHVNGKSTWMWKVAKGSTLSVSAFRGRLLVDLIQETNRNAEGLVFWGEA